MWRFEVAALALGQVAASSCAGDSCSDGTGLLQMKTSKAQGAHRHAAEAAAETGAFDVEFFKSEDLDITLPLPGDYLNFPPQLDGVIWMDQSGYYGHSDVPAAAAAPDGCFTFGDPEFSHLLRNADGGTINVDTHGPAWQWFNNHKGYMFYKILSQVGFRYRFEFSDNFNHAAILGTGNLPLKDGFSPPEGFLNFTMEYQSLYLNETACPRTNSEAITNCLGTDAGDACAAIKKQVTACAKWKRVSNILGGESKDYYAYEIVDKHGNRREPYYSMYLNWINSNTNPSSNAAWLMGLNWNEQAGQSGTSFRGIRHYEGSEGLKADGEACSGDWHCLSKCCNWSGWLSWTCGSC